MTFPGLVGLTCESDYNKVLYSKEHYTVILPAEFYSLHIAELIYDDICLCCL